MSRHKKGAAELTMEERRMLEGIWKKIVAVAWAVIAVWLATPIPEVSIAVGVLSGRTLSSWFPW